MDAKTLFKKPTRENFLSYLESKKDINAKDNGDDTLLHYAIRYKLLDIILTLIDSGADVNAKNDEGTTPLHLAMIYHLPEIALLLIKKGADVNATNKHTPLHIATNDILLLIKNENVNTHT